MQPPGGSTLGLGNGRRPEGMPTPTPTLAASSRRQIRCTNGPKSVAGLGATVGMFKAVVPEGCKVWPPQHRLIHNDQILKNEKTLARYGKPTISPAANKRVGSLVRPTTPKSSVPTVSAFESIEDSDEDVDLEPDSKNDDAVYVGTNGAIDPCNFSR